MRLTLLLLIGILLIAVPASGDGDGHPEHRHLGEVAGGFVGTLGGEEGATASFWDTPFIACEGEPADPTAISAPPTCEADQALTWTVEVLQGAAELRVDFLNPYRQDDAALVVTAPGGEVFEASSSNTYSRGIIAESPATGTWTITLTPIRTAGSVMSVRVGLAEPVAPAEGALLPNLRVTPPFELGFAAPINPANSTFMAGDDQNPGVRIGGQNLYSCTADEVQEASDPTRYDEPTLLTRCLRFTAGPHNIGVGHFDVRFPIVDRALNDQDRLEEMTQFIHNADGTVTERDAGTYEYHATHGHWHYEDILFYELLAFDPEAGVVTDAGVGHKSGFCPADQGYGEWSDFTQSPRGSVGSVQQGANCFAIGGNGALGLSAGWGDYYRWQRPGQFVDFSGQGDGDYIVRATVDVLDNVLESDETDNSGYTWVRVTGDEVEIIERGYGSSPVDPDKVVLTDGRGQYRTYGLID